MASAPRPLIAGNWKMNGWQRSGAELNRIIEGSRDLVAHTDLLVCPPATLIASFVALARGSLVTIGAQDCHAEASGAFTGDISAEMLKDAGASMVIVGHSERRTYHAEDDALVAAKAAAAFKYELIPIICIGEQLEVREAGNHVEHCVEMLGGSLAGLSAEQIGRSVIAYEPVWAIGTGRVASAADAQEVCKAIRDELGKLASPQLAADVRVLYGGSVNAKNVGEIVAQEDVDGALVGGASLDGEQFATLSAIAAGGPLP